MKCLLLGGAGFIGAHLADELLRQGHQVRIFDKSQHFAPVELQSEPRVQWHLGNFLDADALRSALDGVDVVFHLISLTLPKSSNDNPTFDVEANVVGTLRMLDLMRELKVPKLIFASSGGTVYGLPQTLPISEAHATDPVVSYGITKLAIEKYLYMYKVLYGIDYCVLRLANPFGERQRVDAAQGAVAVFIHKALRDEEIQIWGDGTVVRDYIYIKDVVRAFVLAMSWKGSPAVFNVGSGTGTSLNTILKSIEILLGRPVRCSYHPARAFDVPVNVLDINLAGKHLGWMPTTGFEEGMANTLAWMRSGQHV
jgi:UDP-glucose 4-epimerase